MRTVEITWGCHPLFRVTFEISGGHASLLRVSRMKSDDEDTPDPSLVTVEAFERVMGADAIADMERDAREAADDEDRTMQDEERARARGGRI